MDTVQKIRVQGLLDPELAKAVKRRAVQGRRPVSREVEYLINLGLEAERAETAQLS